VLGTAAALSVHVLSCHMLDVTGGLRHTPNCCRRVTSRSQAGVSVCVIHRLMLQHLSNICSHANWWFAYSRHLCWLVMSRQFCPLLRHCCWWICMKFWDMLQWIWLY